MDRIIVSRHPAAVEFIARELGGHLSDHGHGLQYVVVPRWKRGGGVVCNDPASPYDRIPVLASATADDVRGKVVYGNLPLHLAALAAEVVAIEFSGIPPRGAEYTLVDMDAAGARLAAYTVTAK